MFSIGTKVKVSAASPSAGPSWLGNELRGTVVEHYVDVHGHGSVVMFPGVDPSGQRSTWKFPDAWLELDMDYYKKEGQFDYEDAQEIVSIASGEGPAHEVLFTCGHREQIFNPNPVLWHPGSTLACLGCLNARLGRR